MCVVYQLRHLKNTKKKSENQLVDLYILKLVSVCWSLNLKLSWFLFSGSISMIFWLFFFLPPTNLLSQNPIFLQIVQPTVTWEQSRWRTRLTGYVSLPAVACPHPGSVKEHKCTTFSVREHVVVLQWWVTLSWRLFLFAGPGVDGQRQNQPRL